MCIFANTDTDRKGCEEPGVQPEGERNEEKEGKETKRYNLNSAFYMPDT